MGELNSAVRNLPRTPGAPDRLAGTGGTDGFGGFGRSFLKDSVGRGGANRSDDVATATAFLEANGFLDEPADDTSESFFRGIESAQTRLNELSGGGLRVDGIARPWGPTEILSQRAVSAGRLRPPDIPNDQARPENHKAADANSSPSNEDGTPDSRLRMELDVAANNRRAAVERAAKKEAAFKAASDATNHAWEKVKSEGIKVGIQVGIGILSKRGRPASAGLHAAVQAYEQAKEEASRLRDELHLLRADIASWDAEIRDILSRMENGQPTS